MFKTITASTIVAFLATSTFAGNLTDATVEAVPQDDVFVPAAGSGIGAPVIIGGVVAAAALAAIVGDDDETTTTTTGAMAASQ